MFVPACRLVTRERLLRLLLGLVFSCAAGRAQTPPDPAATPVPDPHQELEALLTELSTVPAASAATSVPVLPPPPGAVAPAPGLEGEKMLFEFYGPQAVEYASRLLPGLEGAVPGASPARAVHHEDGTFSLVFQTEGATPLEFAVTHDAEGRPLRTAWTQAGVDETKVTDLFGRVGPFVVANYPGVKESDLVMDPSTSRAHQAPDGTPEFHATFVFRDPKRPIAFRMRVDRTGQVLGHDRIVAPRVIEGLRDSLGQVLEESGAAAVGSEAPVPAPGSLRVEDGGAVSGVYRWARGAVALTWRDGAVAMRRVPPAPGAAGWIVP